MKKNLLLITLSLLTISGATYSMNGRLRPPASIWQQNGTSGPFHTKREFLEALSLFQRQPEPSSPLPNITGNKRPRPPKRARQLEEDGGMKKKKPKTRHYFNMSISYKLNERNEEIVKQLIGEIVTHINSSNIEEFNAAVINLKRYVDTKNIANMYINKKHIAYFIATKRNTTDDAKKEMIKILIPGIRMDSHISLEKNDDPEVKKPTLSSIWSIFSLSGQYHYFS